MIDEKKVIIRKKEGIKQSMDVQKEIEVLKKLIDSIKHKINYLDIVDNKEWEFLQNNKEKEIVLRFLNGQEENGYLLDIDKYRIVLRRNEKTVYFYKHSLLGYYSIS